MRQNPYTFKNFRFHAKPDQFENRFGRGHFLVKTMAFHPKIRVTKLTPKFPRSKNVGSGFFESLLSPSYYYWQILFHSLPSNIWCIGLSSCKDTCIMVLVQNIVKYLLASTVLYIYLGNIELFNLKSNSKPSEIFSKNTSIQQICSSWSTEKSFLTLNKNINRCIFVR